jgi:predicted nucleotidyltransferase
VSDPSGEIVERVTEVLRAHGVKEFAFTGGVAVGVWAIPRQTRDIDVCGFIPADEVNRLLAQRDGMRTGPNELPDLIRFRVGDWDVDLFVSKDEYDAECMARAVTVQLDGAEARIVTAEDLLIHKMMKLRTDRRRLLQDLADIRAVSAARGPDLDLTYLRKWLPAQDAEFLESVATTDDEELLQRLLNAG